MHHFRVGNVKCLLCINLAIIFAYWTSGTQGHVPGGVKLGRSLTNSFSVSQVDNALLARSTHNPPDFSTLSLEDKKTDLAQMTKDFEHGTMMTSLVFNVKNPAKTKRGEASREFYRALASKEAARVSRNRDYLIGKERKAHAVLATELAKANQEEYIKDNKRWRKKFPEPTNLKYDGPENVRYEKKRYGKAYGRHVAFLLALDKKNHAEAEQTQTAKEHSTSKDPAGSRSYSTPLRRSLDPKLSPRKYEFEKLFLKQMTKEQNEDIDNVESVMDDHSPSRTFDEFLARHKAKQQIYREAAAKARHKGNMVKDNKYMHALFVQQINRSNRKNLRHQFKSSKTSDLTDLSFPEPSNLKGDEAEQLRYEKKKYGQAFGHNLAMHLGIHRKKEAKEARTRQKALDRAERERQLKVGRERFKMKNGEDFFSAYEHSSHEGSSKRGPL